MSKNAQPKPNRKVEYPKRFEKDLQKYQNKGKDLEKIAEIMDLIESRQSIPAKHKDHPLLGIWKGYRELHIEPDWLLIYKISDDDNIVFYARTDNHDSAFRKPVPKPDWKK